MFFTPPTTTLNYRADLDKILEAREDVFVEVNRAFIHECFEALYDACEWRIPGTDGRDTFLMESPGNPLPVKRWSVTIVAVV